jgi:hypothetical protein
MSSEEGKEAWKLEDTRLQVLDPGTRGFEMTSKEAAVRGHQSQPATILYDSLALRYNQCEPGQIMLCSLPNRPTTSNMRRNLQARGLTEDDYRLFRPMLDTKGGRYPKGKQPLAIQRLTARNMKTIQPYAAEAAQVAREAEERAAQDGILPIANPSKPGPASHFPAGIEVVVNT